MTPAVRAARRAGVAHRLHTYAHDRDADSYGGEAVEQLGVAPERVFKTLVVEVEGVGLTVAVVPVSRALDLKRLAAAMGGKRAELAGLAAAERATGYVAGGISPLGQRRPLPTLVDASATAHPTVFVSGGRRGLEIELAPADLVSLCAARTADLAR